MSSIDMYPDSFVDYCFHMGKLEADKIFWDSMLAWTLTAHSRRQQRRIVQDRVYDVDMLDYEE